jgi:hypothetical protein
MRERQQSMQQKGLSEQKMVSELQLRTRFATVSAKSPAQSNSRTHSATVVDRFSSWGRGETTDRPDMADCGSWGRVETHKLTRIFALPWGWPVG